MKYLLVILTIILCISPLIACSYSDDTPKVTYATAEQIKALQAGIDKVNGETLPKYALKTDLQSYASVTSMNDLSTKVAGLSGASAPNLTNYYTKTEVDVLVKKAIDDYKASIGSGGTSVPSSSGIITPNVIPATVNIGQVIALEAPIMLSGNQNISTNGTYWFQIKPIKNLSGTTRQIQIRANLIAQPSGTTASFTSSTNCSVVQGYIIGTIFPISYNPIQTNCTSMTIASPLIGVTSGYDTGMIQLRLDIIYTPSTTIPYWIQSWDCIILQ